MGGLFIDPVQVGTSISRRFDWEDFAPHSYPHARNTTMEQCTQSAIKMAPAEAEAHALDLAKEKGNLDGLYADLGARQKIFRLRCPHPDCFLRYTDGVVGTLDHSPMRRRASTCGLCGELIRIEVLPSE